MIKARWRTGLAALGVGVVGILGLGSGGQPPFELGGIVFVQPDAVPGWARRLALVDDALDRGDVSRASYQWREAYGEAVKSGRREALIAVGDRAFRIAKLGGGSGYFLTEGRHAYVQAALRARAEGSPEAIVEIAERFERLGDTERAAQLRRIAASAR